MIHTTKSDTNPPRKQATRGWDEGHEADGEPGDPEENGLPGMKAYRRVLVIRRNNQKDDRGDDRDVRKA